MNDATLETAKRLKQDLIDYIFDAEGELAVALETYSATPGNSQEFDIDRRHLTLDSFAIEGTAADRRPIDWFLDDRPDLSPDERRLLERWQDSFMGLFEVKATDGDTLELMNWISAKHYPVVPFDREKTARLQPGDILLTRIAPLTDDVWMLFGSYAYLGKLGKPKLAVAVGNFKENYASALYADAPELLELAWESVAEYHREFVEFFGSDRITLPGKELSDQIGELQQRMTDRRLSAAGIDPTQSLSEMAREAGVEEEELVAAASESGADASEVTRLLKGDAKMVRPKIELPDNIKRSPSVTVFSHPRWGQTFLPNYSQWERVAASAEETAQTEAAAILRQYIDDPSVNYWVWQQIAREHPAALESSLQTALSRPDFRWERDAAEWLNEIDRPEQPKLPETASIPQHLQDLFEAALAQVNSSKSKKKKAKSSKGF
ncbi:MAG TPA: hypothetical protein IGS17_10075 [Oscillatoriales cyanobacterium M59_W2019_021]|nr:hypothetical protein [Oscillatoriales cyanobacterium M4454_W2019_049]HIK51253.1 hypothetical protein [Oscillatoriales cyanobacterium M59_W2019_021]